jgi:hypothetical protein
LVTDATAAFGSDGMKTTASNAAMFTDAAEALMSRLPTRNVKAPRVRLIRASRASSLFRYLCVKFVGMPMAADVRFGSFSEVGAHDSDVWFADILSLAPYVAKCHKATSRAEYAASPPNFQITPIRGVLHVCLPRV